MANAREAFVMEDCTFEDCTIDGIPIPGLHHVDWFCSCGHKNRQEHAEAVRLETH